MEGSGEKETLLPSPPLPSPPLPLLPLFFGGKGGGSHSNFHAIARMQTLANVGLSLSELLSLLI